MLLNDYAINDDVINGDGTLLLTITKSISEEIVFSGTLLSIEKQITFEAAPTLLYIAKIIERVFTTVTFYEANGWDVLITLDGLTVDRGILTGGVQVVKQEDDNHTAEFTMILEPDVYDLYTFQGSAVTIWIKTDVWRQVFTGIVDVPTVNVFEEKLTLACIADRRDLLENLSALEPYIGYYSETVLGNLSSVYDRINARISTLAGSMDFDSYNQYSFNSWTPKVSPDFLYTSSDVFRRAPTLSIESAGKIINTVNLSVTYDFQRLHERSAAYTWFHPYCPADFVHGTGGICPFLIDRPSTPTRALISSAINAAGWTVDDNSIFFGQQFKSGNYLCNGSWVAWSTIETAYMNAPITDPEGNPVTDDSGKPLVTTIQTHVDDTTNVFTMYAQWNGSLRFSQNIKEFYNITIQAPTSVALYGALATASNYGYTNVAQYQDWSQSRGGGPDGGRLVTGSSALFYDLSTDRATFNQMINTAMNKAYTDILKTHRDTHINFQRFVVPEMELKHTVALTGKWIRGKGKCRRVLHALCISDCSLGTGGDAYTDVTLAQYRGTGTISANALTIPSAPLDSYCPPQGSISLETHLGLDPGQLGAEHWNGYIGNIRINQSVPGLIGADGGTVYNWTRTNYQESFIVDTPAIPSEVRDNKTNYNTVNYNINIPTDSTVYESYG